MQSKSLELTEADIPGALLEELLDKHSNEALRWWLLCRGISIAVSTRKSQLIERIQRAKSEGTRIVDVECSQLEKKRQRLLQSSISVPPLPPDPPCGWLCITQQNMQNMANHIPCITPATLYSYLAEGVGCVSGDGAFRALKRGYQLWASGRISRIEVNTHHPEVCFLGANITPSMRAEVYKVSLLLSKETGDVKRASCDCAAGKSACCIHVSGILHALCAVQADPSPSRAESTDVEVDNEFLPVTSYICHWRQPRQWKESDQRVSDVEFEKHVFGRTKKHHLASVADFDPRPSIYKGTANDNLRQLLDTMWSLKHTSGLSVLLDPACCCRDEEVASVTMDPPLSVEEIRTKVEALKLKLTVSSAERDQIEAATHGQRESKEWYDAWKYRITASVFGEIRTRRSTTSPDALVSRILQGCANIDTPALRHGRTMEKAALNAYISHMNAQGHCGITVRECGFYISLTRPYLGATPDGAVCDPSFPDPNGFVEVKCPFKYVDISPEEASMKSDFFCNSWMAHHNSKETTSTIHRYRDSWQMEEVYCGLMIWT